MARDYIVIKHSQGAFLRIREDGAADENLNLQAASDPGLMREAEKIINDRFYGQEPFPGFDWRTTNSGLFTTDHDLRH